MSEYYPHQIHAGQAIATLIKKYGVAYLAGEPRTGKSRAAFYAVNQLPVSRVMFVTKKNAIPGILKELHVCTKAVTVTNYEQITKHKAKDFDFVVVDEAHNIASVGRPSKRFKELRAFCWDKPVLLLSGTPMVESPNAAYYQFAITKYTPLQFKSFYQYFTHWGVPSSIFVHGRQIETYKKARPELLAYLDAYTVKLTQEQAGIEEMAQDVVHRVELSPETLELIKTLRKTAIARVDGHQIVCESEMAIRAAVHQIESGAIYLDGSLVMLGNTEMVDYIRHTFGDSPQTAVMCHYRASAEKVRQLLPRVHVYSSDGHSEGVDLSAYKNFVILNTGYSGAKHVQRRDRGTRIDITTARKVHHIISPGQLSEAVYKQVSKKLSFNVKHLRDFLSHA